MAQQKKSLRIIWALDILSQDKKVRVSAEKALKAFSRQCLLQVVPVYVVRLSEQVAPFSHGEGKQVFLQNVKSAMKRWLEKNSIQTEEPVPILQKGIYLRSDIDALVSESKKQKADFILVNTHARKGLSRFWMGSFAETLMLHSQLPVLFLNPQSKPLAQVKTILVPTQLTPGSDKALNRIAEFAKQLEAQLVLYNNIEYFVATPELAFTETMVFTQNIQKEVKQRKKSLDQIASKLSKKHGLKVKTLVDEKELRVSDGIIRAAKKHPGCLIAMTAQTGPVLSVLVGSTTRRVVREATVPVMVFR
ncbi:universal stress protein [bacterium]|nr:universal stress protein [bacterium]